MRSTSLSFASAVMVCLFALPAFGELPPGSYVKLRKDAPILLKVRVTETAESKGQDAALQKVLCTAEIEAVEKAPKQTDLKAGATVAFDAYYLSESAAKSGFAGPRWPVGLGELGLKAGWRGRVYLRSEEGSDVLKPAAYGESFQPLPAKVDASAKTSNAPLLLGAAERDVTPPVGFDITHYVRKSKGVRDPLYVRAMVLSDRSGNSVAIVTTDLIGAGFEVCDHLRERIRKELGIQETILNASHSHSSIGLGMPSERAEENDALNTYYKRQHQAIMDAVAEAKAKQEPVTLYAGRAPVQVGFNRRLVNKNDGYVFMGVNENGPVVPWVNVLTARSQATGESVAVLFEHAAHPVIVPHTSGLTSADYPGAAVARVREELGNDVIAMFGQGCGGNINGFPLRTTHENAEAAGRRLGNAVLEAMAEGDAIEADTVKIRSGRSWLPSNDPPNLKTLAKWQKSSQNNQARTAHLQKLKGLIEQNQNPPPRRLDAYALMLGDDWCLVTMPHEMFCQYELWVDEAAPFKHNMTFGYTNGGQGYIAVDEAWKLKERGGYEAGTLPNWGGSGSMSGYFGPPRVGSEQIIKETIQNLWPQE